MRFVTCSRALPVAFALFLSLAGCGGGGSGSNPAPTPPRTVLALSPAGPKPTNMTVTIGAISTATPDSGGAIANLPPSGATSTVFVTDNTTNAAVLLAVVPKGASPGKFSRAAGNVEISPRTTIEGMLFLRLGGWLLPQDKHQAFMAMLDSDATVQQAVTAFQKAYQTDGHAFAKLKTDATLAAALQKAMDAATADYNASPLMGDLRASLGVAAAKAVYRTRGWSVDPEEASALKVSVDTNTVSALNEARIIRFAQINDENGAQVGTAPNGTLLTDASFLSLIPTAETATKLNPNPLPEQSPLKLSVSGGFQNVGDLTDPYHLVPVGSTIALNIVIPLVDALTGLPEKFDPNPLNFVSGDHANPFQTSHPLLNWTLKAMVYENGATALGKPVPKLITKVSALIGAGGDIDWAGVLLDWVKNDVLDAIATDVPGLAGAIVAEAGSDGLIVSVATALKIAGIFLVPEIVAVYESIVIGRAVLKVAASTVDLLSTPWNTDFTIDGKGVVNATVRSASLSKRSGKAPPTTRSVGGRDRPLVPVGH